MHEKQYVSKIVKLIKCGGGRKKQIRQDLSEDVRRYLKQGKTMDEIVEQMGTVKEVADNFNENLAEEEKKKYKRNKILKIAVCCVAVLLIIISAILFVIPKNTPIESSERFQKAIVQENTIKIVELLDSKDYTALQECATEKMKTALQKEIIEPAKEKLSSDWGENMSVGQMYIVEISQMNVHSVVTQVTVGYENLSVTYTITFDEDMKLAGLYMK